MNTFGKIGYCVFFIMLKIALARPAEDRMVVITEKQDQRLLSEPCTALVKEIESLKVDGAKLQCSTPSGMLYNIPYVDTQWIRTKQLTGELFSGKTQLEIPPYTQIDLHSQILMLESPPKLVNAIEIHRPRRQRNLQQVTGTRTVLVVRIQATNSATTASEAKLASDVFGDDGDDVNNLRSQYLACSYGQLEFTKTADKNGADTNIQNGVVTVDVGVSTNVGDDTMINYVNAELLNQFSTEAENLADHVMYCMPPGTMGVNDVAYAWMNDWRSVYNDDVCSTVSAQMHEVGHNLNLGHSKHEGDEYGDQSGMMGYSYSSDELPYMCFNSAKSFQLGWYSDKALTIAPHANRQYYFQVKLAGVADYGTTSDNVVLKIEQNSSSWAYFVNYNAAKGINRSTQEGPNQVLVTRKKTNNDENLSTLLTLMSSGNSYQLKNFNGRSDETLTLEFSSLGADDVANISITLSGPTIPSGTNYPSHTPSMLAPSIRPSNQPTQTGIPSSSRAPSLYPSISPSNMPTNQPSISFVPSRMPSSRPTEIPSTLPTAFPTMLPSVEPSLKPSSSPSSSPSKEPSSSPSAEPSTIPSAIPSSFPSLPPSFKSTELESILPIEIASTLFSEKMDIICQGTEALVDKETKETYGIETSTSLTCIIDSNNTAIYIGRSRQEVKARTFFPRESTAPNQTEYATYLNDLMAANKTAIAMAIQEAAEVSGESADGIVTEVDHTVDPPALIISLSSGQSISALFGVTISLIFFVVNC